MEEAPLLLASPTRAFGILLQWWQLFDGQAGGRREAGLMASRAEALWLTSPLAQGSLEPGETLPLKLKWILRREFWPQFQNLLKQGTEVGAWRCSGGTGAHRCHSSMGTRRCHCGTGAHRCHGNTGTWEHHHSTGT